MIKTSEPILFLGRIGSAHGLKGALVVHTAGEILPFLCEKKIPVSLYHGEPRDGFLHQPEYLRKLTPVFLQSVDERRFRIQFEGIADRNQAEELTNSCLGMPLIEAENWQGEGEFLFHYIGLKVTDPEHPEITGRVKSVIQPAGRDMLEIIVIGPDGKESTVLIPLREPFVPAKISDPLPIAQLKDFLEA